MGRLTLISRFLQCLIFIMLVFQLKSAMADKVYTVGVVPQFDSRTIDKIWRPVLDRLQKHTGFKFVLHASPSIPDFEQKFINGDFDFAYLNPYHMLIASRKQGYIPLVRDTGRSLRGVLVVRKDSGIKDLSVLQGKVIAFPSPNALGASLLMRAELKRLHNLDIKPRYVKSHDSVYLNVVLGQAAAGGGVGKTLQRQSDELKNNLRVLYRTSKTAPHPFATHPRVQQKVWQQVRSALLLMGSTDSGRKLLARIPMKQAGTASLADYEPLKAMGLDSFYQENP